MDHFAELNSELAAELAARHHQYAFYRDELLNFDKELIRWAPMGELGNIFGGLVGKSKDDFANGNARYISYTNVFNNIAVHLGASDCVRVGPSERQRTLNRGDVIFTGSSETADEVAMSSVVTGQVTDPLYLNSFSIGYRLNDLGLFDFNFLKHLFAQGASASSL